MQFALMGDDLRILPLARAVLNDSRASLTHLFAAPRCFEALRPLDRSLVYCSSWSDLLTNTGIEAIIVCGGEEAVLEAARQLASAGRKLLVLPQADHYSTFVYEMALVEHETSAVLFPVLPWRAHPGIEAMAMQIRAWPANAMHFVRLERTVVPGTASAGTSAASTSAGESSGAVPGPQPALIDPAVSRACFLEDADALQALFGSFNQVGATQATDTNGRISMMNVTLQGSGTPQVVWSLTESRDQPTWRLSISANTGQTVLGIDPTTWAATLSVDGQDQVDDVEAKNWGPRVLRNFFEVCAGQKREPNWTGLTRDFELLEALPRSVARRRTIDLHFEVPSERTQFKTQMTAAGCSTLMLTLVAIVIYLVAAAAFDLNPTVKRLICIAIFIPLALFLLLQVLVFLTRPAASRSMESADRS